MKVITENKKRGRPKKNKTLIEKIESKKVFGFTLIELLAVIIILGVLMIIAIPAVTEYISSSRKSAYIKTANQYISGARTKVNAAEVPMYDVDATYYLKSSCISLEKGGTSPFGEWEESYVVITYDGHGYDYYWTSRDSENMGILLTDERLLNEDSVKTGITSISTDIGIEGKNKILLINDCSGTDITEKIPIETIPKDGKLEQEIRPEEDYNNYVKNGLFLLKEGIEKEKIEEIYTVSTITIPSNAIVSWDISSQNNNSIMAWLLDEDNDNMYELYLGQNKGVIANPNSHFMFSGYKNVTKMDLRNFDTSKVTDMSGMFLGCTSLTELDLNSFNTRNVTNMSSMFQDCNSLIKLNVSSFNTSKVINMRFMFVNNRSLKSLDVSNFNTSNVTDMLGLFMGCNSLTSLDLRSFNTSKVTSMENMFNGNTESMALTSVDLSSFDTKNVTKMNGMFSWCDSLTTLNLSNFDTSNVTDMSYMFNRCNTLTNLNVRSFNTSKVENMSYLFYECESLSDLNLSSFETANVTSMKYAFYNCHSLTNLDISNFDVSNVTNFDYIFYNNPTNCNVKVKNAETKAWILSQKPNWNITE